jgi:hypothetical protein
MKKMFVKIKESVEEKLRKLCAGLSPEKRVPAIVMLAALFAIGNFYMIFRAIHDIGREDVRPDRDTPDRNSGCRSCRYTPG